MGRGDGRRVRSGRGVARPLCYSVPGLLLLGTLRLDQPGGFIHGQAAARITGMRQTRPFAISGVITGTVMVAISFFIEDAAQSKSTLVAGLIAAVTIAAIPIYDINSWSLTKRSLVHFLAMLATVFPLLLFSEWFTLPVAISVFLLFGIVGWTIGYVVYRVQEKKQA